MHNGVYALSTETSVNDLVTLTFVLKIANLEVVAAGGTQHILSFIDLVTLTVKFHLLVIVVETLALVETLSQKRISHVIVHSL